MSTIPKAAIGLSAILLMAGAATAQSSPAAGQSGAAGGDFATYDADGSGSLDSTEFSSWYQAKHQTNKDGKPVSADDLSRKATQAFSQADADRDQRVSQEELSRLKAG